MSSKICSICTTNKPLTEYYTKGTYKGRRRYEAECKTCSKGRQQRSNFDFERRYLVDARRDDKRRGQTTDLTHEFIRETMSKASCCSYCECNDRDELTLDRIDNSLGHLKTNVVVSCLRCNVTRGDRDYVEWLQNGAPEMRAKRASMSANEWKQPRARYGSDRRPETP